tara:strand:+ start:1516 stop:2319 length:804 start_codon:yes stop_codon:yes gene_type:complete
MNKLFPIVLASFSTLLLSNPFSFIENIMYGDKHITSATFYCNEKNSISEQLVGFTTVEKNNPCIHIADLIKSRPVLKRVIDNLEQIPKLLTSSNNIENKEYANARLRELLTIENHKNTDVYRISIESYLPNNDAVLLINTILQTIIEMNSEWRNKPLNDKIIFLENQISKKDKEIESIENSIKEFQEKNAIYSLDANTQSALDAGLDVSELTHIPQKVGEFYQLRRDLEIANHTYSLLRNKYEKTKIEIASNISPIRIIDSPDLIQN